MSPISATTSTERDHNQQHTPEERPMVRSCQFQSEVRNMEGSGRALALACSRTNVLVFLRPPATHFSPKNERQGETGNGGPTSSGKVRSFRCRAARATPSMWAAPGRTTPSQWSGAHQCDVDGELHACPQTVGGPRQPLPTVGCRMLANTSKSRTMTFVDTRAQLWATAFSTAHPRLTNNPTPHMLHNGSKIQIGGHIGNATSGRERKTKPAEQKDPEQTRGNAQGKTRRCGGPLFAKSLKLRSTLEAASCCHPVRHKPGSNSSGGGRRCTMQNRMPQRWFETHHT